MKAIKIYLAVVTVLLIIAIGFGIYVWFTVQSLNSGGGDADAQSTLNAEKTVPTTGDTTTTKEPITITTDSLTPTQQKMLETFGYTQDSFTITPTMLTCAEEAVGKVRLAEITGGAAPSPLESMKLLPCYKK